MKKQNINFWILALVMTAVTAFQPLNAQKKTSFKVAWSIYAGWNPWDYASKSGILDTWAKKYGVEIKLVKMDYIASIEAYTSGEVDACVMTNMDALTIPVASGIESTAVILGDFSNGNDAILVRNNLTIPDLVGRKVSLVEFSVSHYLLSRALDMSKMKDTDVKVINVSDSDIAPAFVSNSEQEAVVTWNPLVMEIMQTPGVTKIFDSSQIPGEILDLMMVNSKTLKDNPDLAKALNGAWFEVMGIMSTRGPKADNAMEMMAKAGGSSLTEYKAQLKTTAMFYKASDAITYMAGDEIQGNMKKVRNFCFKYKLLGDRVKSAEDLGISFPGGIIIGNASNVMFHFDDSFMKLAAENKL
ncbi:MAG TPA: lipid kinase [Marinilabiliales bacterium]|jgi:NitT/TauT family transport system substrate-binding protein|nr:MAG: lipid kinase [Bacteroidetes bacterium GWA2_40_14]OFX60349.1 MAG: lipid kinase [Bacteroidetes bacterium GWC2_40_13]OFX76067.1 MAG: lipid kinase [Bacteroidetes bacterium GWD2_40_43]OFX94319.1 MAG: lipid kinase [Bacteroidetes bacterium GWE2_40_63]OFY18798.1 MAG: lipid kinase [Bacteroidetes bacterium GWF2_40_13]OFZ24772.1 MAG: lipid kinase [Bacteroidetes bacterium RIFOXYC2_FULL_40_12]HAM99377.1 lipid kinase [Marinilabiliales bacterium]